MSKENLKKLIKQADEAVLNIEELYIGSGGPFASPWMPSACIRLIKAYEALKTEANLE